MNEPVTPRQLEAEVNRELVRIRQEHLPQNMNPSKGAGGKCRVCSDPVAKRRVNTMLTHMMRPAEIVENLADVNERKKKNQQIGYWSVYLHRKNHFQNQDSINEGWVRMMERRAEEEGIDLAQGVGSILTLRGMLDIVAHKGMRKLMDPDTAVAWQEGVEAQAALEKLLKADKDQAERAAMRRDLALIQQAIVETLDEAQMKAVSHKLDVLRGIVSEDEDEGIIEGEVVEDDDDGYGGGVADFVADIDDDDELGE